MQNNSGLESRDGLKLSLILGQGFEMSLSFEMPFQIEGTIFRCFVNSFILIFFRMGIHQWKDLLFEKHRLSMSYT